MAEPDGRSYEVFVVSDGTGETGASAVRAVMMQFQNPWRLRIFGGVRQPSEIRRVIAQAAEANAMIVFSLVEEAEVHLLQHEAKQLGVPAVDLLGPVMKLVAAHLHAEPRHEPGLLHAFSEEYLQRVEAVEFAVNHDDGANLRTLHEADIVLTGVSRTSKTPLSMYLAQRGYKAGNVPLVPGVDPPRELLDMNPRKVFGLSLDHHTLSAVRQARVRALNAPARSGYTDAGAIEDELRSARRLFRKHGWAVIEIGGRAVEESASKIIEIHQADAP